MEIEDQVSRDAALIAEENQDIQDMLVTVLNTHQGRWFFWRILEEAGIFHDGFNPNPIEMARLAGKRQLGLKFFLEALTVHPGVYNLMQAEAQARNELREIRKERLNNV